MGIWDALYEIAEAVTPWSVAEAEAPAQDLKTQQEEQTTEAASKDDEPVAEEAAEGEKPEEEQEEEEEEEADDDEEDEEDEDEIVDPKETIEEECRQSARCAPAKHHFDECVERVQQQEGEGEAKEDCVEEFFHLTHCATACAAPKLWAKLK